MKNFNNIKWEIPQEDKDAFGTLSIGPYQIRVIGAYEAWSYQVIDRESLLSTDRFFSDEYCSIKSADGELNLVEGNLCSPHIPGPEMIDATINAILDSLPRINLDFDRNDMVSSLESIPEWLESEFFYPFDPIIEACKHRAKEGAGNGSVSRHNKGEQEKVAKLIKGGAVKGVDFGVVKTQEQSYVRLDIGDKCLSILVRTSREDLVIYYKRFHRMEGLKTLMVKPQMWNSAKRWGFTSSYDEGYGSQDKMSVKAFLIELRERTWIAERDYAEYIQLEAYRLTETAKLRAKYPSALLNYDKGDDRTTITFPSGSTIKLSSYMGRDPIGHRTDVESIVDIKAVSKEQYLEEICNQFMAQGKK